MYFKCISLTAPADDDNMGSIELVMLAPRTDRNYFVHLVVFSHRLFRNHVQFEVSYIFEFRSVQLLKKVFKVSSLIKARPTEQNNVENGVNPLTNKQTILIHLYLQSCL